jgi:hypothetical protein
MPDPGYVDGDFEVEFLPYLHGSIGAKVCELGEAPSRILDIHDPWYVQVDWTLTGPLSRFICGSWAVDVYMESIGRGPEFELPDDAVENIPLRPGSDGNYSARIDVPADFIKTHLETYREEHKEDKKLLERPERETDIVYKMVCTVTYKDPSGKPGPIAGFVEMPMMQFYEAE